MNQRRTTGVAISFLGLVIALLDYLANQNFWYWQFWWLDIIMHFLGGLFIALIIYWFLRNEFVNFFSGRKFEFIFVFVVMMTVGVLWEMFEYLTGAHTTLNYELDTVLDLLMDAVGVLAAFLIYKRL